MAPTIPLDAHVAASATRLVKQRGRATGGGWDEALHPRDLDGRFAESPLGGGIAYSGIVHATVPKGEPFAGTHVADVVSHSHDGSKTTVSLHLDEDHPAVKDALGDGIIRGPEEFEAQVTLPSSRVRANNDTVPLTRYASRAQAAHRARQEVKRRAEERRRNEEAHRASGDNLFPELDAAHRDRSEHPRRSGF